MDNRKANSFALSSFQNENFNRLRVFRNRLFFSCGHINNDALLIQYLAERDQKTKQKN